ncbi:MAG: FG-GAP-like repeat-containing protein [Luteolibacter sp.]
MRFNYSSKYLTVLLLQMAMGANAMAAVAFTQPFENTSGTTWTVDNGTATLVSGESGATGNSLELTPGTAGPGSETKVVQPISWSSGNIAFIDVMVKPAASTGDSMASIFTNGSQIAFQGGKVWAYQGTDGASAEAQPDWVQTSGSYTVTPGGSEASSFLRVTLRHDYDHAVWDLFIDGQMVAANLSFEGRGSALTAIEFYGSLAGKVHLDELQADPANMLFTDADKDGLPDAWELANGGNPALYDRDTLDANGKSLLQKYMESLWAPGAKIPNGKIPASLSGGGGNTVPPLTITGEHQPVGTLKGAVSVAGDGSSGYSIPIDIPKGTAGMEPKLALNYSSNGGNGICGVGWSLGGLQRITRGPASAMKDGYYDPVDFDEYDRFFLDGERLICVSGTYGANGSEYRTEMDTYTRATLIGSGATQWWKLETKSGMIVELGHTTDSVEVFTGTPGGVMTWNVSKVSDASGNYYSVGYVRDTVAGMDVANLRVDKIAYTGKEGGQAPNCNVLFDYEDRIVSAPSETVARKDYTRAYSPQLSHFVSKRLAKIRVVTDTTYTNHSYVLKYTGSYQSSRSFLTSVQKQARDNAALALPATTFTYDGLASGASPWGSAAVNDQWPVYNASWDATGNVNSMVSTSDGGTAIRLDGDVARYTKLPVSVTNLSADSVLTFKVKGESFVSGAFIGVDNDMTYSASPSRLTLIKGSGTAPAGIAKRATITYAPDASGWMSVSIPIGSIATGSHPYLALINVDDNPNDGVSSVTFKDLRIYRTSETVPANPITFSNLWEVPHFSDVYGRDLGIRFMDLNADGLMDMCDWRAADYGLSGGVLTPNTVGQVYRNTGSGFVVDTTLKPDPALPLSSRKDDTESYNYDRKHHLFAQQVDINGDGKPDLLGATAIKYASGSLSNDLTFYTQTNGAWGPLTAYKLPFRVKNIGSTAPYGGTPRDQHCEWIDIDSDGYTDLVFYTTTQGKLVNATDDTTVIVGGDTTTCWLNKVHLGLGWVRKDNLGLPEMLQRTYPSEHQMGRRLLDITGDGHPEIMESLSMTPEQRYTYKMTFDPNGKATGWETVKDAGTAPASPLDLPKVSGSYNNAPFTNVSGDPIGGDMIDLNGDGLPDYIRKVQINSATVGCVYMNLGKGSTSVWNLEPAAGVSLSQRDSFDLPRPLYFALSNTYYQTGNEVADINGDGLTDILISQNTGTDDGAAIHNVAMLNTGNGWEGRPTWGLPSGYRIFNTAGDSQNGKRRARLQDLNGDGFPDLIIGLVDQNPEIWLNQCKAEVLTAVDNGLGGLAAFEYRRLNDPTPLDGDSLGRAVYEPNTGDLDPGQIAVRDNRLVVSRLKESDGQNGWLCSRRHYGDLRCDRLNDVSLGFKWTEVHNEFWPAVGDRFERGYMRTVTSMAYPNAGSPVLTETYVNVTLNGLPEDPHLPGVSAGFKKVSESSATYGELPYYEGPGGRVRRPVQVSSVQKKYDLSNSTSPISKVTSIMLYDKNPLPAITWVWDEATHKVIPSGTASGWWNDLAVYGGTTYQLATSLDGSNVETSSTFDPKVVTETRDGSGAVLTAGKWQVNRCMQTTELRTSANPSSPSISKQTAFDYVPATGLMCQEIITASGVDTVTKTYDHDAFGNLSKTTISASGQDRIKQTNYDSRGRFMSEEIDSLGQKVQYQYASQTGTILSSETAGGLTTYFGHDDYGTKVLTCNPEGTSVAEITRYASNSELPSQVLSALNPSGEGVTVIRSARAAQASGTPSRVTFVDTAGHEVVTRNTTMTSVSAGGTPVFEDQYVVTKYDNRGRKIRVSNPFLAGDSVYFTNFTYDAVDRLIETVHPDDTSDGVVKLELQTVSGQLCIHSVIHNRKGAQVHRWDDQHGRLIKSSDPSGQVTTFEYSADNRITRVSIDGTEVLRNKYDAMGQRTEVQDADAGKTTSVYNGFGEVVSNTNARLQATTTTYDTVGRVTQTVSPEGTWTRTYVTSGPAAGQLSTITGPAGYQEVYTYEAAGRVAQVAKTQFGGTLVTSTTYNALGDVKSQTDAGGVKTVNLYESVYGSFKTQVVLHSASTGPIGTTLWKFDSVEKDGDVFKTTEILSETAKRVTAVGAKTGFTASIKTVRTADVNKVLQDMSYTWDANGNLLTRTDGIVGKTETFAYDGDGMALDRLSSSTVSGQSAVNYTYAPNGNLLTKDGASLDYSGSRPHAVSSGTVKGGSRTYAYDADGNATTDGVRNYEWTSFGQLSRVTQTSCPLLKSFTETNKYVDSVYPLKTIPGIPAATQYLASSAVGDFYFDSAGTRAKQDLVRTFLDTSKAEVDKTYAGGYEREVHSVTPAGGSKAVSRTIHRHTMGSAIYTVDDKVGASTGPVARLSTLLTDPLGSTDVILVSEWSTAGWAVGKAERQSFSAWGERRNADTWASLRTASTDDYQTSGADYDRGYTGHEMLDDFGLIHMNGRIYDAEIGRFLSADPYVQVPEWSQNFNRYSYVLNNPLTNTDPTGHQISGFMQAVIMVVSLIVSAVSYGLASAWAVGMNFGTAMSGAIGAGVGTFWGTFTSSILSGVKFGDALLGAAKAGLQSAAITFALISGMESLVRATNPKREAELWKIDGKGLVPKQKIPLSTVKDGSLEGTIFENGMLNDLEKAIENGKLRVGPGKDFYLSFNPTNGPLPDLLECSLDRFAGQSDITRSTVDIYAKFKPASTVITAHSQGTMIATNALRILAQRQSIAGFRVYSWGAAQNELVAHLVLEPHGVYVGSYVNHPADPVANIVGLNALTKPNPYRMVSSLIAFPLVTQGPEWSPHSLPLGGKNLEWLPWVYDKVSTAP